MVAYFSKGLRRLRAWKHRRGAFGVVIAFCLGGALTLAACSVELAPLSSPDAASGAGDAGTDACVGCGDASVADACSPGLSPWGFGRCCPPELDVEFDDASVAGVLIHGEHAIVYGARGTRPWVARVDRCDGSVVTQNSDFIVEPGQFRSATLAGDTLVLGGSYDTSSKIRWMAAWGDATSLSDFSTYLATNSTNSIASAVAMPSSAQAWFVGTHRYQQSDQRAMLMGLDLDSPDPCVEYPKGWFGGGVGLDATNALVASLDGYKLRITSYESLNCAAGQCGCNGSSNSVDLDQRYLASLRASAMHAGELYVVGASFKQVLPVVDQGAYVARIKPDLSLDAFQVWGPSGSLLDDARALDFSADGTLAVGVARACDFALFQLGECSLGAVFGLPGGFDGSSGVTFGTTLSDWNEVTGVRFEPEPKGGLLLVGNRLPASPTAKTVAALKRCTRDGACP